MSVFNDDSYALPGVDNRVFRFSSGTGSRKLQGRLETFYFPKHITLNVEKVPQFAGSVNPQI